MKFDWKFAQWRRTLVLLLLSAPLLVACAKSSVPVPIHGVNYAADAFSYALVDPTNPENTGGGELVEPFSAGGTMCCYTLPAKWRPGMKVEIRETHWLPKRQDNTLPEVSTVHVVELPSYVDGKAGELWVIRALNGSMSVVSSNFQPDHVSWPGTIKGWPVPSLDYQRARQDLYIKDAHQAVELYISLLKELKKSPTEHARETWALWTQHSPAELKGYRGPDDAAYLAMLRKSYESSLIEARKTLQREMDARP